MHEVLLGVLEEGRQLGEVLVVELEVYAVEG